MKTRSHLILATLLTAFFSLTACEKDHPKAEEVNASITLGTWSVTYYNNGGVVETTNYTDYSLTFYTSGTLTATKDTTTITGTWSTYNLAVDDRAQMVIAMGTTAPWSELAGDWQVDETNSDQLLLHKKDSGASAFDELHFDKD